MNATGHIICTQAKKTCNVARSREELGMVYKGKLEQYR